MSNLGYSVTPDKTGYTKGKDCPIDSDNIFNAILAQIPSFVGTVYVDHPTGKVTITSQSFLSASDQTKIKGVLQAMPQYVGASQ